MIANEFGLGLANPLKKSEQVFSPEGLKGKFHYRVCMYCFVIKAMEDIFRTDKMRGEYGATQQPPKQMECFLLSLRLSTLGCRAKSFLGEYLDGFHYPQTLPPMVKWDMQPGISGMRVVESSLESKSAPHGRLS